MVGDDFRCDVKVRYMQDMTDSWVWEKKTGVDALCFIMACSEEDFDRYNGTSRRMTQIEARESVCLFHYSCIDSAYID